MVYAWNRGLLGGSRVHPKGMRGGRDQAKLISSNDTDGFTFRGRLIDSDQTSSVSYIASQKAHNALRWLIKRQGYQPPKSDQVVVAWAVSGQPLPDVIDEKHIATLPEPYEGDVGQLYANRLNKFISGYDTQLTDRDDIVVMALDSATPGRMAITYYRELKGSEFFGPHPRLARADRVASKHGQRSPFHRGTRAA
jgi:CRISPR-associated protein Csd1